MPYCIEKWFLTEEQQIDRQLQNLFKPKHTKAKLCKYCNDQLTDKDTYSYWVDINGITEYICRTCGEIVKDINYKTQEKFCLDKYGFVICRENTQRCFSCRYSSLCGKYMEKCLKGEMEK